MNKLAQLRKRFETLGIDGMLITNAYNRRYLTGFTGTFGIVLISKDEAKFVTDFRYMEQAAKQVKGYEIVENRDTLGEVAKQLSKMKITKLGFEQDNVSFRQFNELNNAVEIECVPVSGLTERLRMVKTNEEIEKIKTAVAISDQAFNKILDFVRPGVNEMDINNQLEAYMRQEGAKSSSFDAIIASGFRSALPHGTATNKVVNKGDMLTLDFGAYYEGYCSDMTRTISVGEPKEKLKEIYDIVLEALNKGIQEIKNNVSCKQVDEVVRDFITSKGYEKNFGHGTGHGIGLEIHEAPNFSQKSDEHIETGMVMTVEPGIYLKGIGGVRIEDDVLVTEDGYDILTQSPKDLIIV